MQAGWGSVIEAVFSSLFYVNNLHHFFGWDVGPFHYYWSLSLEEQYYFLWPVLCVFLWQKNPSWAMFIAATGVVVSLVLRFWGDVADTEFYKYAMFTPFPTVWALLLGSLLGMVLFERRDIRVPVAVFWPCLAFILLIACFLGMKDGFYEKRDQLQLYLRLIAGPLAAFLSMIVVTGIVTETKFERLFTHRVLLFFGMISYALYLWHGIFEHPLNLLIGSKGVLGMVSGLTAAILATVVAYFSWVFVEEPFLRLKKKFSPKPKVDTMGDDVSPVVVNLKPDGE